MDKKTTRFGTSDAIIINDLGLKNKIIDFLFSSIDLSNYRYNMLSNVQRFQFLKDNEHYVTPNFMGYNYLLLFLTIDGNKYSVAVDKKRLSYHKNQVNLHSTCMTPFVFLMFICFWTCCESHTAISKPASLRKAMLLVTHIFISECNVSSPQGWTHYIQI